MVFERVCHTGKWGAMQRNNRPVASGKTKDVNRSFNRVSAAEIQSPEAGDGRKGSVVSAE